MTASATRARAATATEIDEVVDLSLAAFADEAVMSWAFQDASDSHAAMRRMFGESLGAAIESGSLLLAVDSGGNAVAMSIWLPSAAEHATAQSTPQSTRPADPSPTTPSQAASDGPVARRLASIQEHTTERVPDVPHLLLSAMAVLPTHRGRGAGSVLIRAGLDRAGALGLPVYLEASSSDNRRLYERFGFRDRGGAIELPDGGPVIQPMWREG